MTKEVKWRVQIQSTGDVRYV